MKKVRQSNKNQWRTLIPICFKDWGGYNWAITGPPACIYLWPVGMASLVRDIAVGGQGRWTLGLRATNVLWVWLMFIEATAIKRLSPSPHRPLFEIQPSKRDYKSIVWALSLQPFVFKGCLEGNTGNNIWFTLSAFQCIRFRNLWGKGGYCRRKETRKVLCKSQTFM